MNEPPMDDLPEGEDPENKYKGSLRPMGELCFNLLGEAIRTGATEIQIRPVVEPFVEPRIQLRLRVKGDLVPGTTDLPWPHYRHLISRLKKMGSMDVAERRMPQSGKMRFKYGEKVYNMTLQIQPIHEYESCVIYLNEKDF